MNYEKLTVDKFAEKLASGKYDSLTGARRAIGKTADWSVKQRETAKAIADKHFSSADGKAKKAAPKAEAKPAKKAAKKPVKKAVLALVPAPVAQQIKPPAKKPAPKAVGRRATDTSGFGPVGLPPFTLTAQEIASNPHHAVSIADRTINSVSTAIATVRGMKKENDQLDISEIEETGVAAIKKAVALLEQTIDPVYACAPTPKGIKEAFGENAVVLPQATARATLIPVVPAATKTPEVKEPLIDPKEQELFNKCADAAIRSQRTPEQVLAEDGPQPSH